MKNFKFSLLFPMGEEITYKQMSEQSFHDLGLDDICNLITKDNKEQNYIKSVISHITSDERTTEYRQKVFADILALPDLRKKMTDLFERLDFIRTFTSMAKASDEKLGLWYLLHKLDEIEKYICCVEEMRDCLSDKAISSEGLIRFKEYIDVLYNDACFAEMKKDIAELKEKTSEIQSVTIGVNVNSRFEAISMGLISVNNKQFKKSGIVSNLADAISSKNKIQDNAEWNGDMHFDQIVQSNARSVGRFIEKMSGFVTMSTNPFLDAFTRSTIVNMPDNDETNNFTVHLDTVMNKVLDTLIKRLREILSKYVDIAIADISLIVPEFIYYIRFADFISKYRDLGFPFCEAVISDNKDVSMDASGIYNLKLAVNVEGAGDIVYNDIVFDKDNTIYMLTGANRGGKTTITQAIGQVFALAQGGIFVPASSFSFIPADCIYTHFPADEDKTLDYGRLGEECIRFREIYKDATEKSLLLMNETFSTTSFEEGYYIASDSLKALKKKGARTIFNTHMHKLAAEADEFNTSCEGAAVSSLIVKSDNGKRSFKVERAKPEGLSYAKDIAEKYGVTYELLISEE